MCLGKDHGGAHDVAVGSVATVGPFQKRARKKTGNIDFDATCYRMLAADLNEPLVQKVQDAGVQLNILPQPQALWMSFMAYLLLLCSVRNGVPSDRLPESSRSIVERFLLVGDTILGKAISRQDLLHAPARTRAPQSVALYYTLHEGLADVDIEARSKKRLFRAWFHVLCIMIYVKLGDAKFNHSPSGSVTFTKGAVWAASSRFGQPPRTGQLQEIPLVPLPWAALDGCRPSGALPHTFP